MKTDQLRKTFLDYFGKKGHVIKQSDLLVPSNDPTLLFTSAGMVQFKHLYLTKGNLEFTRVTTCQKCFRADLDEVGYSGRHHTFFEMLGNFSFGDYFKEEAIKWAWEFVTEVLKIQKDPLWVSIYKDDDETFGIWNKKIGFPPKKIVRLGKDDNFWGPVGKEGGACGPCSEIYIDHGEEKGCKKSSCKPGCHCNRFEEFWNLVFPSYNQDKNGKLNKLEKRGIDTGMGLERVASILQKVDTNFEIDIIKPIVLKIADLAEIKYKSDKNSDISVKIIADHLRALVFLICDGVLPSNDGRGYVLRRILRRASMQGRKININEPFLFKNSGEVVEIMKSAYPELSDRREYIASIIQSEEERFSQTLDSGMKIIENLIEKFKSGKGKKVPGKEAFKLYDTYGFPVELTKEILSEHSIEIDDDEFKKCMDEQQEKSRKSWKGSGMTAVDEIYHVIKSKFRENEFTGYEDLHCKSKVLAIIKDSKEVDLLNKGESAEVILDKTPFYAQSGGQVADKGVLLTENSEIEVYDVISPLPGIIVHKVKATRGKVEKDGYVNAKVDSYRRREIAKHHTSTHLLQAALRKVLGTHVSQSGSEVRPDKLRFDFTHFQAISDRELARVEDVVNESIFMNISVIVKEIPLEKAREEKALAFFGEKYSSKVRMVDVAGVSKELCGGTHLSNTSEIGLFKIISESSVSAGVRRIEAVAGNAAYNHIKKQEEIIKNISVMLKTSRNEIVHKVGKILEEMEKLGKELKNQKALSASSSIDDIIGKSKKIGNISVLSVRIDGADFDTLRQTGDGLRDKLKSGVVIVAGAKDKKAHIIVMSTGDVCEKADASAIAKELSKIVEGSGGGKSTLAQAGGKNPDKLDEMLNSVPEIIKKIIKS